MSDPTARRGDHITALLEDMKKSKKGWTDNEIKNYLWERYRYGVRDQTLDAIIMQLKDRGKIYKRPIRKGANVYRWHLVRDGGP